MIKSMLLEIWQKEPDWELAYDREVYVMRHRQDTDGYYHQLVLGVSIEEVVRTVWHHLYTPGMQIDWDKLTIED